VPGFGPSCRPRARPDAWLHICTFAARRILLPPFPSHHTLSLRADRPFHHARHTPCVPLPLRPNVVCGRTLDKTLQYFRSKRPDLNPKPGFLRQLLALDQSLQRLTLASVKSPDDPLLRRCSTWDTTVLRTWGLGGGASGFGARWRRALAQCPRRRVGTS